jgi:hypothetical protein
MLYVYKVNIQFESYRIVLDFMFSVGKLNIVQFFV